MVMEEVQAKKLGVVFSPPTLILLYKRDSVYKKLSMPVRELSVTSDCSVLAARLQARHKKQLSSVNIIAIEKMIRLIQEIMKGHQKSVALEIVKEEYSLNPEEDLNRLTDKELKRRKAIMDLNFKKNNITKDHPDFVYDKEVDFSGAKKTVSTWDSSSSDEEPSAADKNPPKSDSFPPTEENPPNDQLFPVKNAANDEEDDLYPVKKGANQECIDEEDEEGGSVSPEDEKIKTEFLSELTSELTRSLGPPAPKPLGAARPLLEPLSGGLPKLPLHKALPPLDLSKLNRKQPDLTEDTNVEEKDSNPSSSSFSDDDDEVDNLLGAAAPASTKLERASKAKALFGLDSDEEVEDDLPKKSAAENGAKPEENGGKPKEENGGKEDATPRSISVGDLDNNDEDDFW